MPGAASTSRVTLDGPSARGVGGVGGHDAVDPLLRAPHARHPPLSYGETVQLITEFLEVVLHTVLCVRSLYPQEVFTRKKTYGTPVWQARHPGLCEYIANAAKEVKKQMLREAVHNAVLLIKRASTGEPLERFVFRLDYLLPPPALRDRGLDIADNLTLPEAQLFLRGMIDKLMALQGRLAPYPNPEDITHAIVIEVREGMQPRSDDKNVSRAGTQSDLAQSVAFAYAQRAALQEAEEGPWVPLDPLSDVSDVRRQHALRAAQSSSDPDPDLDRDHRAYTLPLKTLRTGVINVAFYAEEHVSNKRPIAPLPARPPSRSQTSRGKGKAPAPPLTPAVSQRQAGLNEEQDRLRRKERKRRRKEREARHAAAAAGVGAGRAAWREAERDIDEHSRDAPGELYGGAGQGGKKKGGVGAAMGIRMGGGVQNGADIGDDDDDDRDERNTVSSTESDESDSVSSGDSSPGSAAGLSGASDNEMNSVAGIGFGGPAKPPTARGW